MLRILIIAPYPITPPDTGAKIRIYELAMGLSQQGMQVTVLMPMSPSLLRRKRVNPNLIFEVVPYPFLLPFLFTNKPFPYMVLVSLHPGFRFFIRKYLNHFDVIQFEQASFGDLVDMIPPDKSIIYDAHNVESDYSASECISPWVRRLSHRRIFQMEQKLSLKAHQILTCSTADSHRIAQLYHVEAQKFTTIPNGIHLKVSRNAWSIERIRHKYSGFMEFKQRAIFSGSDIAHNREAVRFIIDAVAPRMQRECAFLIQGQCGKSFLHRKTGNVFFDPDPGNVGPYADACTVALNPVMQGSGTSLKVLDYLIHGLPVVSTPFGMRGYEDLKSSVTLAEQKQFTEAIMDGPRIPVGFRRAVEPYAWLSITQKLYGIYHSIDVCSRNS